MNMEFGWIRAMENDNRKSIIAYNEAATKCTKQSASDS